MQQTPLSTYQSNRIRWKMYSKLIKAAHDDICEFQDGLESMEMTYDDWQEVKLICDVVKELDMLYNTVKKHVEVATAHTNPRGRGRM